MYFQWYRYCFSKYFTFQGRASRTEYWSFTIINLLILWVFWFISKLVDIPEEAMSEGIPVFPKDPVLALIFGSLYLIFCIAIFFPSLAVTVRRLHDRNHSGFWVIAQLIPLLNLVVLRCCSCHLLRTRIIMGFAHRDSREKRSPSPEQIFTVRTELSPTDHNPMETKQ